MTDICIKIESQSPRKSYFNLAGLLELGTHIKDRSGKGLNFIEADTEKYRLLVFGSKNEGFDANYNFIELKYRDVNDADIHLALSELLPIIEESDAKVHTIEIDVPTEPIGDMLFRLVSESASGDEGYQFRRDELKKYIEQLSPFAKSPNLGLLKYSTNQVPYQSAVFTKIENTLDISDFFDMAKELGDAPLREILRENYASSCTTFIEDGKELDRALAYMASQYMGIISMSNGIESLGWFNNPATGLSYNLTAYARAVAYLVWNGVNTPEKMHRFISQFSNDIVGMETYRWDENASKMHAFLSQNPEFRELIDGSLDEKFGIQPSAEVLPEIGATIHYTRVNYILHRNSPLSEKKKLDRMADLGILKNKENSYSLDER